jgi:hypothetical protein
MAIIRRLEIEYCINGMSTLYEENSVSWSNAEFTFNKDLTANLKLWQNSIEPEQISETLKELEKRAESFRVALKYLNNHVVSLKKKNWPTYYFDDQKFTIRTEKEIDIIIDYLRGRRESCDLFYAELPLTCTIISSGTTTPVPLPLTMLSIPSDLHRMAETLVAADDLVKYPDLTLKLAFLILEELKTKQDFDENERKVKYTRDFVSHLTCNNPEVVAFVTTELPTAIVNNGVQFKRDMKDHVAFVSKYAYDALRRAKELFEQKVQEEGGFINN